MKQLYRFQIVLFFWLLIPATYGQELELADSVDISIEAGELKTALQLISNETGIRFGYREKIIQDKKVVKKEYHTTLETVFKSILVSNQLCFTQKGNQVIIHTSCLLKFYSISGYVIEDVSYKALPYISISISGKPIGVIADHDGYFEIDIPYKKQEFDTLIFSSLGYFRDSLFITAGIDDEITAVMTPKTYAVPELIIRPVEYKTLRLGNTKDRPSGSLYLDTHGQQTALRIINGEAQKGIIESVEYFLSKKGNTNTPFRVRIYEVDSIGKPGKDLVEDAIVVRPEIESGWYKVDISMLRIKMPLNGVFVSIEGVFPDEYENLYGSSEFIDISNQSGKELNKALVYGQRIGYNRKNKNNTWHYSINKVWFQLEKQSFGVMISAVVKYEKEKEKVNNSNYEEN